jgi:hypothetical protein
MVKIEATAEVSSNKEQLWNVISDLDNEPDYWFGTKSVRTISRNGNEIDREVTGQFRNNKTLQKVILYPQSRVEVLYLKGLTVGLKTISIETLEQNRQKLTVSWNVRLTGFYWLLTPSIKRHLVGGTLHAIQRIKQASERLEKQGSTTSGIFPSRNE